MVQTIAVIGGDARYLELIRQLQTLENTTIILIGFDNINQSFIHAKQQSLSETDPSQLDVIILPIRGTSLSGEVETIFSNESIELSQEWFKKLHSSAVVFTGISNSYLDNVVSDADIRLIPLMSRDDVAIYNSIPTAEGTLMLAMENTDYTIHSANVTILGYGRIGQTIADRFKALRAHTTVLTDNETEYARVCEQGHQVATIEELAVVAAETDILINTIPAPIIDKDIIKHVALRTLIIDLASKPGGTDFVAAEQRGIKAILAKALPGTVAPKTSGAILANVVEKQLKELQKGVRISETER